MIPVFKDNEGFAGYFWDYRDVRYIILGELDCIGSDRSDALNPDSHCRRQRLDPVATSLTSLSDPDPHFFSRIGISCAIRQNSEK